MRKNLISVEDAKAELLQLGYSLVTRKYPNAIIGWVRALKSRGREPESLEGLSRPTPEVAAAHPELIAWVEQNAIVDGSNLVVL